MGVLSGEAFPTGKAWGKEVSGKELLLKPKEGQCTK
jgi:hypothetical protein